MPQMNKGGKFIFGKSLIRTDGTLRIPPQAMEEYRIADEGKVYLFTGSKITGGFCVTRKGLLHPSKLGHILDDTPPLLDYSAGSGEFIKYKGRSYCWIEISQEGQILLTKKMMDFLKVRPGMELLSIRSSDIAFTMGAKGPLLEKADNYDGEIPLFRITIPVYKIKNDVGKPRGVIGGGHALHALLYGNLSSQLMNSSLILPTMCCVPAR